MSNKLKLATILGTRPEIIRLSETIKACDRYFDNILIHTGQNYDYELNQIFFDELGLRAPDYFLNCAGKNLGETMGNVIAKTFEILEKEKPDAVLILGDTNSALSAISAKRLKLPIFHMEAGNRCWDWNVAEMTNRTIVDHISDVNLPYTENARRYLLQEGIDGKTIFVTGSPMKEVLAKNQGKIDGSNILAQLRLEKGKYIIVSAHREENIDIEHNFFSLMNSVNTLAERYKVPVIFSTHPRTRKFLDKRKFIFNPLVINTKPFGLFEYVHLEKNALCVVSDSGTLTEESAIERFPAVLIRTSTERPEGLDAGSIVVGGIDHDDVIKSVDLAISTFRNGEQLSLPHAYEITNTSIRVVKIIQSYTSIINLTTWHKYR